MARRPSPRLCKRRLLARCLFCGEADPSALDSHRVIPGASGGSYTAANIIVCCASCHRKAHAGRIVVLGRHTDTLGRWFVRCVMDGEERWLREAAKGAEV